LAQPASFAWDTLDLDEDFFEFNANLEITFAMLTPTDSSPYASVESPQPDTWAETDIAL
jgi:hypothetical protein